MRSGSRMPSVRKEIAPLYTLMTLAVTAPSAMPSSARPASRPGSGLMNWSVGLAAPLVAGIVTSAAPNTSRTAHETNTPSPAHSAVMNRLVLAGGERGEADRDRVHPAREPEAGGERRGDPP